MQAQPTQIFQQTLMLQFKALNDDAIEAKAIKLHHSLLDSRTAMNTMAHINKIEVKI